MIWQGIHCEAPHRRRPLYNSIMELVGAALETSWSSLNSETAIEESELMAQFLASHSLSNEQNDEPSLVMQSLFWSDNTNDSYYEEMNANTYYWPMDSSCNFSSCSNSSIRALDFENGHNSMESNMISTESMVLYMTEEDSANKKASIQPADAKRSKGKRKIHLCELDALKVESPVASPKKRARTLSQAGKSSKRSICKKGEKNGNGFEKEVDSASPVVQSSSCYSSEDETNISEEFSGGGASSGSPKGSAASLKSNGKTRAGRGSATDPQSLYARKRRERINERLKILQNLVPNGTKVDISTMLEEAVQYVKFLQVQIKLLSSDELWMYAPIAYGMNIGIDLKITPS